MWLADWPDIGGDHQRFYPGELRRVPRDVQIDLYVVGGRRVFLKTPWDAFLSAGENDVMYHYKKDDAGNLNLSKRFRLGNPPNGYKLVEPLELSPSQLKLPDGRHYWTNPTVLGIYTASSYIERDDFDPDLIEIAWGFTPPESSR